MENTTLSLRDVIVKNINCVIEGVSTRKEAVDEIMAACLNNSTSEALNNITIEDAVRLHNDFGITFYCGDGQVKYAAIDGLN